MRELKAICFCAPSVDGYQTICERVKRAHRVPCSILSSAHWSGSDFAHNLKSERLIDGW